MSNRVNINKHESHIFEACTFALSDTLRAYEHLEYNEGETPA